MERTRDRRITVLAGIVTMGAILSLGLLGGAGPQGTTYDPGTRLTSDLPECPVLWDLIKLDSMHSHTGDLSLPKIHTNVPEYNDCQRFVIESSGTPVFGPLVAIFASFDLDRLLDSLARLDPSAPRIAVARPSASPSKAPGDKAPSATPRMQSQSPAATTTSGRPVTTPSLTPGGRPVTRGAARAVAAAEIFNFDAAYTPLGIGHHFNCLYVYYEGGALQALMVHAGDTEPSCLTNVDPATAPGMRLEVRRYADAGFADRDYPAVARWDWDARAGTQYIGIKCGAAWCEVGRPGFTSSPVYAVDAAWPSEWRRVFRIKGWYDQQRLAIPNPSGGGVRPSTILGTIVPHPYLDRYVAGDFQHKWAWVASAMLGTADARYEKKLNLTRTAPGATMNRIYVCNGKVDACLAGVATSKRPKCPVTPEGVTTADAKMWWTKIVAADGDVAYLCADRRDHTMPNMHVVGTSRWRWRARDESTWSRCTEGCCEVRSLMSL